VSTAVRWLTDEAALDALVPDWAALWAATPGALPFQSPAWLMAWWRAFRPGRPWVLALRRDGRLAGVLPLYEHGGTLRLLGAGTTDLQDAPLDPTLFPAATEALRALAVELPGATLDLFDVVEGSALLALPLPPGWREEIRDGDVCPVLDLTRPLPAGAERNLRHARARARRAGGLTVERVDARTLPDRLDALFRLHGARWAARGEPGVFAPPAVRAFHRAAAAGLLETGALRLTTLFLGGRLAAVHYGLCHGGRAFYYIGGFDPEAAAVGPGTLAVGHAIREAVGEGAREFHFLRGREPYKYRWGAQDRTTLRRLVVLPRV